MKKQSSSCLSDSYSLSQRLKTIFRKASELSTLCDVEVCVIYFGPNGELKTWPEERQIAKDIAFRFMQLDEKQRRKKSTNLYEFLNEKKKNNKDDNCNLSNKKAKTNPNELKHLVTEYTSPDQISELTLSLEQSMSTLRERLRFIEERKEKETKLFQQETTTTTPITSLNHHESQCLNPNQFSLFIYNHGDNTFSQIPPSAFNFNQNGFENQLMMTTSATADNSFVSNTQDTSSALLTVEESESENQWMHNIYIDDHNTYNNNEFLDPYASMDVGSCSFSQDMITSSYGIDFDESGLLLQSLDTIPNSYFGSELVSSALQSQW